MEFESVILMGVTIVVAGAFDTWTRLNTERAWRRWNGGEQEGGEESEVWDELEALRDNVDFLLKLAEDQLEGEDEEAEG